MADSSCTDAACDIQITDAATALRSLGEASTVQLTDAAFGFNEESVGATVSVTDESI